MTLTKNMFFSLIFCLFSYQIQCVAIGTHVSAALALAMQIEGPILEFGSNEFSTHILHTLCSTFKRSIITIEENTKLIKPLADLNTEYHCFIKKNNLMEIDDCMKQQWSLIIINNNASNFVLDILKKYQALAYVIQASSETLCNLYKSTNHRYKYIDDRYVTKTLVMSNEIDVTSLLATNKQEFQKNREIGNTEWGTHSAPLITVVNNTTGPVLEMGSGDFSTPLLHALCAKNNRMLVTADMDSKWLSYFKDLATSHHIFQNVDPYWIDGRYNPSWDKVGGNQLWDVVFIDHSPGRRRVADIIRLRPVTKIFVVHDTEANPEADYGYEPTLSSFKYKYVYDRFPTQTTVVSDVIDVRNFFKGIK